MIIEVITSIIADQATCSLALPCQKYHLAARSYHLVASSYELAASSYHLAAGPAARSMILLQGHTTSKYLPTRAPWIC